MLSSPAYYVQAQQAKLVQQFVKKGDELVIPIKNISCRMG